MKHPLEELKKMSIELGIATAEPKNYGPHSKVLSSFSDWVANLQMEGRMITPSRGDLADWLSKNYPSSKSMLREIWELYNLRRSR